MQRTQPLLFIAWSLVVFTYLLGVSLPMANVEKFIVFDNEFSLIHSVLELASHPSGQNVFLLVIIVSFTFIFPLAKLATMFLQIRYHGQNWQNRMTRLVETVGHFSMLDVFIIALMVLLLKLRVLVDVSVHAGFYCFTASIVGSIALSFTIKRLRGKASEK